MSQLEEDGPKPDDPTEVRGSLPHRLRLLYPYFTHSRYVQHLNPKRLKRSFSQTCRLGRNYGECEIALVDQYISRVAAEIYMDENPTTGQFHIRNCSDKFHFYVDSFTVEPGKDVEIWNRSRIRFNDLHFGENEKNNYIEFLCDVEISKDPIQYYEVELSMDKDCPLFRCARNYAMIRAPWNCRSRNDPDDIVIPYCTHMEIVEGRRRTRRPWDNSDIDLIPKNPRTGRSRKGYHLNDEPFLYPGEREPPPVGSQQDRPSYEYQLHHGGRMRHQYEFGPNYHGFGRSPYGPVRSPPWDSTSGSFFDSNRAGISSITTEINISAQGARPRIRSYSSPQVVVPENIATMPENGVTMPEVGVTMSVGQSSRETPSPESLIYYSESAASSLNPHPNVMAEATPEHQAEAQASSVREGTMSHENQPLTCDRPTPNLRPPELEGGSDPRREAVRGSTEPRCDTNPRYPLPASDSSVRRY